MENLGPVGTGYWVVVLCIVVQLDYFGAWHSVSIIEFCNYNENNSLLFGYKTQDSARECFSLKIEKVSRIVVVVGVGGVCVVM